MKKVPNLPVSAMTFSTQTAAPSKSSLCQLATLLLTMVSQLHGPLSTSVPNTGNLTLRNHLQRKKSLQKRKDSDKTKRRLKKKKAQMHRRIAVLQRADHPMSSPLCRRSSQVVTFAASKSSWPTLTSKVLSQSQSWRWTRLPLLPLLLLQSAPF